MLSGIELNQIYLFVILAGAIILLFTEWLRIDLTAIGHHGNLLIYGPGRYQFGDFVRVGVPLTLIAALIVSLMAPLLWPS